MCIPVQSKYFHCFTLMFSIIFLDVYYPWLKFTIDRSQSPRSYLRDVVNFNKSMAVIPELKLEVNTSKRLILICPKQTCNSVLMRNSPGAYCNLQMLCFMHLCLDSSSNKCFQCCFTLTYHCQQLLFDVSVFRFHSLFTT